MYLATDGKWRGCERSRGIEAAPPHRLAIAAPFERIDLERAELVVGRPGSRGGGRDSPERALGDDPSLGIEERVERIDPDVRSPRRTIVHPTGISSRDRPLADLQPGRGGIMPERLLRQTVELPFGGTPVIVDMTCRILLEIPPDGMRVHPRRHRCRSHGIASRNRSVRQSPFREHRHRAAAVQRIHQWIGPRWTDSVPRFELVGAAIGSRERNEQGNGREG